MNAFSTFLYGFIHNTPLMAAIVSTCIAQLVKLVINLFAYKKLNWYSLVTTGGMPSSHTACVGALWLSTAMIEGSGSTASAIAFIFGAVVYRDAVGVRRQAGIHASILNSLNEEMDDSKNFLPRPLKTLLGHTPTQALVGLGLGLLVGFLYTTFLG